MASRRRKKALPPWLQGVSVSKSAKSAYSADVEHSDDVETGAKSTVIEGAEKNNASSSLKEPQNDSKSGDQLKKSKADLNVALPGNKKGQFCHQSEKDTDNNKQMDEEVLSMEQVIAQSYEEYIFSGSIIYSHNSDDCNLLCDDLISEMSTSDSHYIGFDTEWPVTYQIGRQSKTALIQVATSADKCYLFHVSCMPKFPVMLRKLIEMDNVFKIGLNIENDLWKLEMDYDLRVKEIIQKSTIDLRPLANKKLRSAENWSLEGLAKNVLRRRISKDPDIRKCDWSQFPLPEQQQKYAATDAAVSLMIFQKLNGTGTK